jgi:hypothetical protein
MRKKATTTDEIYAATALRKIHYWDAGLALEIAESN